jgi:secreted trypsin-like serine protease
MCLVLAGCGAQKGPGSNDNYSMLNGIVNGSNVTSPDTYSQHVVFLQSKEGTGAADCTGSILDSQTILTAAHCVYGTTETVVVFALNAQNPKSITQNEVRPVDQVTINPNYQPEPEDSGGGKSHSKKPAPPTQQPGGPEQVPTVQQVQQGLDQQGQVDNDIAVLHFTGGLPAGYTPVKLASNPSTVRPGATLIMIGYGLSQVKAVTKGGQTVAQPVASTVAQLRETSVPVYAYDTRVGMILTSGAETSVCSGDSGGPGFMQDSSGQIVQVGIAEAVANEFCNSASMHTAVFPFLGWIQQVQQQQAQKGVAQR